MKHDALYDVVGIGVGPANLSLAALLHPVAQVNALFLEARDDFAWHPGLLMNGSTLQSSYLKDLVSLVDPCNPFSFFNFLVKNRRVYRFLVADQSAVSRQEYAAYYRWAAKGLASVRFAAPVRSVRHEGGVFAIDSGGVTVRSRHLVIGSGAPAWVPPHLANVLGPKAFHAAEFLSREPDLKGKVVAVVGGGQTGAEIAYRLLRSKEHGPKRILWISRRANFIPLDESPFANEYFTPRYADYFYSLPARSRESLLDQQRFASDGVSETLLRQIYQCLYELDFVDQDDRGYELLPGRELVAAHPDGDGLRLKLATDHATEECRADVAVFCTGYKSGLPDYLASLKGLIDYSESGVPVVRSDFSLSWAKESTNRIFVHGMSRGVRGVAEPNLGLMSWRSAHIVNALCGRPYYDIATVAGPVSWPNCPAPSAAFVGQPASPFTRLDELTTVRRAA
ncbi:MAG: SidA/IucD/PvdA family monooxygenase [Ramlibacter sp.]|nr:SidA/IucD/PvdA family monooxygenase [Ramlibacter sp.]